MNDPNLIYFRRKRPKWIPAATHYTNKRGEVHPFCWEHIGTVLVFGMCVRIWKDTRTDQLVYTDGTQDSRGFMVRNLSPNISTEAKRLLAMDKMGLL